MHLAQVGQPPWVKARTRLSVAAEVLYIRSSRCGSGMRDSGVKSSPLTASPRYDGSVTPSRVSDTALRGFANWPAMRPTFTTGTCAP